MLGFPDNNVTGPPPIPPIDSGPDSKAQDIATSTGNNTTPAASSQVDPITFIDWRWFRWFRCQGVGRAAIVHPELPMIARGIVARDGIFDPDPAGDAHMLFVEDGDAVVWDPRTGTLGTVNGRSWCLGQDEIRTAGVFGKPLPILADPLEWLRRNRRGLVVLDWSMAFDRLRDLSSVAVAERILPTYRAYMKPALPALHVITEGVVA